MSIKITGKEQQPAFEKLGFIESFKKNADRTYKDLFKDIEITRPQFLILLLNVLSFIAILTVGVHYLDGIIQTDAFLGGNGIAFGFVTGIIGGAWITDRTKQRFPQLIMLFFSAIGISGFLIIVQEEGVSVILGTIIGGALIFVLIIIIIITFSLFLEYTTILERGRIISFILILGVLSIYIFYLTLLTQYTRFLPLFVPLLTALYLWRRLGWETNPRTFLEILGEKAGVSLKSLSKTKDIVKNPVEENKAIDEKTQKSMPTDRLERADESESLPFLKRFFTQFNIEIVPSNLKYYFILFIYGFLCGLIIPLDLVVETLVIEQDYDQILIVFLLSGLSIILGGIFIGFIFDYFGRKKTLSFIVLALALANFFNLFSPEEIGDINNIAVALLAIFVFFLATPLLIGDIVKKALYGRMIGFVLFLGTAGVIGGYLFKIQLFTDLIASISADVAHELENIVYYNFSITSIIFLGCVILLFLLSLMKEEISVRELDWPESLIHLYVIHESGILLHQYEFKATENAADSDLISGGIIGLTTMLKEITKNNERLRTIDHGNKKLIFRWNDTGKVIFVLVVEYETLICRQKLGALIDAFDTEFEDVLTAKKFHGVNSRVWDPVKDLIEFHFTRKYLNLLDLQELFKPSEKSSKPIK